MSSQMARVGLSGTLQKRTCAPRTSNCLRVACSAGRSDGSRHPRLQGVGAAFLAGLTGLPRHALAGDLMTFDSPAPSFTAPTLPDLPASVASSLPSLPINQIQQVISDYPLLIPAGALLLAVPLVGALVGGASQGAKVSPTSAARAVEALAEDERVVIVDIRSKESVKEYGTPDIRATKKKLNAVPFTKTVQGEYVVDEDFAVRFSKLVPLKEDTIIILLDSFGKEAPDAAKLLVKEELPNRLFYVQGGAEGPGGWKESELPWKEPTKLPTLDFSGLKDFGANLDNLAEDFKKAPSLGKAGLALGGIAAGGALIATQLETFLELAVAFAAGNYIFSLLSKPASATASSRDVKLPAAKEVGDDLKAVAKAVVEAAPEAEKKVEAAVKKVVEAAPEAEKKVEAVAKKVEPVVKETVEAAAPQNGAGPGSASPKEEARAWIENWRQKQKQPA